MDTKFLDKAAVAGKQYYQFTAIDDCTRYRIYDHNTAQNAIQFVEEVRKVLPFAVKQIQTDNGGEFGEPFTWHLDDLGITHRKTRIRSPEENGKVERSHRTDEEEFYRHGRLVFHQPLHEASRPMGTVLQAPHGAQGQDAETIPLGKTPESRFRSDQKHGIATGQNCTEGRVNTTQVLRSCLRFPVNGESG